MSNPAALPVAQWQLHSAHPQDDARLLPLFAEVFGHAISPQEWAWKYADSPLRGSVLHHGDTPVAFFGGMARTWVYQGQNYLAVQNGDVMVHPSQRGVFSRRGALYQVASSFFGQHVGPGRQYAFAYGFPSERHMRLGLKLGLYQQAGQLIDVRWPALASPRQFHLRWYVQAVLPSAVTGSAPVETGRVQTETAPALIDRARTWLKDIDLLWPKMQASWPDLFIPLRNGKRWVYRYVQRPGVNYQILILRQRFTGTPLAALALRQHPDHVHWLDYVGPAEYIPRAVVAARRWAGQYGLPVHMLISDTVAPCFIAHGAVATVSDIAIPANASPAVDQPWLGRLWLMGGDSDFM